MFRGSVFSKQFFFLLILSAFFLFAFPTPSFEDRSTAVNAGSTFEGIDYFIAKSTVRAVSSSVDKSMIPFQIASLFSVLLCILLSLLCRKLRLTSTPSLPLIRIDLMKQILLPIKRTSHYI